MKIVVDSNIAFSAILKTESRIGRMLISSKDHFSFYSTFQLTDELKKHYNKLLKITGYKKSELDEVIEIVTK